MHKKQQILGLIGWLVICFSASAIGAIASVNAREFYVQLVQPDWAPPGWLFGPVWTLLYCLMAVSAWLVWRSEYNQAKRPALALFLIQLGLNSVWSWLFFAWHKGAWAFIDIILLWCCIVFTLFRFGRIQKASALLLIPYILWVSFAAVLNYTVWQLNPQILG
ncbi:TspO/MBR family protein [Neptunicella sp.]|uniref:TspO/MBR family protein n=1 Tax=Neptunicella sp. TaxID=2125986 RepID=UPI003F68C637